MDLSSIKDAYISSIPVQSIWLNQIKIWSRDPYNIPPAIKSAMVLWYDIAKQGATNESMAENPILKDLSGNGHDATCYNFAWSGMSGIGGYVLYENNFYANRPETCSFNKNIVTLNKPLYNAALFFNSAAYIDSNTERTVINRPAFKIRVSGLVGNEFLKVNAGLYDGASWKTVNELPNVYNGITDIPAVNQTYNQAGTEGDKLVYQDFVIQLSTVGGSSNTSESIITIEILPQYPNALVSDGVDDYAYVEGLPILTDYTVIAKRKWLSSQVRDTFASKAEILGQGAFIFEINDAATVYSYNYPSAPKIIDDIVSYMTTNEYNGISIKKGDVTDTDKLWISKLRNRDAEIGSFAIYSFLLFNRTLTAEEIEWVKANLINGYPTPNVYYDCSLYTNETIDSANPVLKDLSGHGHDLVLKNFAFAGMSGFGGYAFDAGNLTTVAEYGDAISIIGNRITLNSKPQGSISAGNVFAVAINITGEAGQSVNINIPAFKIKVSGLPDGTTLLYNYSISTNSKISYNWLGNKRFGNGITEIPAINTTLTPDSEADYCYCIPCRLMFSTLANEESFNDITIEILPEYENALVFDGVDDYGMGTRDSFDKCTMLMLFKPTEQQDGISVDFRDNYSDDFAIYRNDYIEPHIAYNARNVNGTYVNNKLNSTLTITDIMNKKQLITVKGKILNTNDFCVGSNNTHDDYFDRMALYKFLLFDQELTQEQIDKVIQDYHLMDDVDDVWNQ